MTTDQSEIDKLREQSAKLTKQMKQLEQKYRELQRQQQLIDNRCDNLQKRVKLESLLGQQVKLIPGAVASGHKLVGAVGTLTELKRSRATVDFGDAGEFTVSFNLVTSAATEGIEDGCILRNWP